MPSLLSPNRYHKLDDTVFLLCNNCGHSINNFDRRTPRMTPESRHSGRFFRGNSTKHFLTWSATAANHKIQKLSKHLAQNVSKFQTKVEKVLYPWDPNGFSASPSSPTTVTPCSGTQNHKRNLNGTDDGQDHQHLLSANNVHVAVVHNLSVARSRLPKGNDSVSSIESGSGQSPSHDWKSRSRRKIDFEVVEESKNRPERNIFELTPLNQSSEPEVRRQADAASSSSNNTSLSGISIGASTLPALSPHWSRASSLTCGGDASTILLPDEQEGDINHRKSVSCISASFEHALVHVKPESGSEKRSRLNSNGNLTPSPITSSTHEIPSGQSEFTLKILEEEPELRLAPWFHAGIPREIALEVLKDEMQGSFIVRESTTRSGCFALSLRVPAEFHSTGIAHYLILRTSKGFKIKGFTKEFGSLTSLVTHHSVMPELLPCTLFRPSAPPSRVSRANSSDFMEPEKLLSGKFTDF